MKIAFVGTHSVGKTTAVWHVGSKLKQAGHYNVEILPELARVCPYPINKKANFSTALWILFEQIKMEYLILNKRGHNNSLIALLDRSVFDEYAYASVLFPQRKDFIRKVVEAWVKIEPYGLLVYFPICWKPENDGIRDTDASWQKQIDAALINILLKNDPPLARVWGDTHQERCEHSFRLVKNYIEKMKK